MENQLYDVIIVGRGPVGLFLACELRLTGLSVLVVERRSSSEGVAETRAFVVHCRTLEILAFRGLLGKFLQEGTKSPWWHYGVLDTRLDFSRFGHETKQNFVLLSPQFRTEEIFLERAKELGVDIVLGIRVESVEPSTTSVTIYGTSSSPDGGARSSFKARGKYLVGADGVRSTIRKATGFEFPGTPATHTGLTGEATLGVPMPYPYIAKNEAGLVIAVQLNIPSGRARLNVFTPARANVPDSTPVTLEDFNEALQEVTGVDYKLSNPCMLGRFNNEARCVDTYRKGRIFLAGDAGHQHLPAGGQGLNVGIQEATNLGWKLGAVIRGYAPDSLLDTYETERLPIAQGVVQSTTAQSVLFFAHSGPELAIRSVVNTLLKIPTANHDIAVGVSGFGVSYPKLLDMILPAGWEALPEAIAGKRALDVKLRVGNGEEKQLSDYMRGGKWVQLRFLDKLAGRPPLPAFEGATEVVDVAEVLEGKGSMYRGALSELLIRPDGYLGFGKR
ncbi:probable 2-polyprenyl-6-methoxyphenol hydroxylase and related FAD-dependent oxidoreductases [Phialocephala subalpina]|uniref:Probable 2-polyprenyl-6-methoxyphenol hydroxylase and related FAD-dependent oxidoreductases n=1 Tax=Phialocephala subalpina TaxID=576137 RepID=A0A1L7XKV6_9HELO|nr:probable 2-polyprenyl-6-methoxyphenol hydroxylase and related FAD-dependent oxidoreductases [Phialocephala subalpina]